MTARVLLEQDEMDRYDAQLIPDLNARVEELTQTLELVLAAVADDSRGNLLEAVARARAVLLP